MGGGSISALDNRRGASATGAGGTGANGEASGAFTGSGEAASGGAGSGSPDDRIGSGLPAAPTSAFAEWSGDSAIIEYIDGKPVIHHGREYRVMTNDPSYDQQLLLLKQIEASSDFAHPSSNTPLPGNVSPPDRFQRASYYEAVLPEPANEREAIASMFAIMANVSVPFGAPYKNFGVYNTEYRSVTDLTSRIYFFQLTTNPSVIWANLLKFDLSPGAPVMVLNPDNIDLAGNVVAKFEAAKAPF